MAKSGDSVFSLLPPHLQPPTSCTDPLLWAHKNLSHVAFVALGLHKLSPNVWLTRDARNIWYQSRRFLEKKVVAPVAVPQPPEEEVVATPEAIDLVAEAPVPMDLAAEAPELEMKTTEHVCILKEAGAYDMMVLERSSAIIRAITMRRTVDDGRECGQVYAPPHKTVVDIALRCSGVRKRTNGGIRIIFATITYDTTSDCLGIEQWLMARVAHEVFDEMHTMLLKIRHAQAFKFRASEQAKLLDVNNRPLPKPPPCELVSKFLVGLWIISPLKLPYASTFLGYSVEIWEKHFVLEVVRCRNRLVVLLYDSIAGEVIPLRIGDQLHAEGILINGCLLAMDESSMTRETKIIPKEHKSPWLMSTCKVADGYGFMLVNAVGTNTGCGLLMASTSGVYVFNWVVELSKLIGKNGRESRVHEFKEGLKDLVIKPSGKVSHPSDSSIRLVLPAERSREEPISIDLKIPSTIQDSKALDIPLYPAGTAHESADIKFSLPKDSVNVIPAESVMNITGSFADHTNENCSNSADSIKVESEAMIDHWVLLPAWEWLSFRMFCLSNFVFAISLILLGSCPGSFVNPSIAGLVVTYALFMNAQISMAIWNTCNTETKMISETDQDGISGLEMVGLEVALYRRGFDLEASLKAFIIGSGQVLSQQITGQHSVYYAASLLQIARFAAASDAARVSMVFGLFKLLRMGIIVANFDSSGRHPLLIGGVGGSVLSLFLLADNYKILSGFSLVAVVALLLYVGSYQVTFGPISWLKVSDIFPLQTRGRGISLAVLTSFGSIALVLFWTTGIEGWISLRGVLLSITGEAALVENLQANVLGRTFWTKFILPNFDEST